MDWFDNFLGIKAARNKNLDKPAPKKGIKRFFYIFFTHFAKVVGVNMLFLLFCVPIVTIPAALCGLNRICILLVRDGTCEVWKDFFKEFKSSLFRSLPVGLLCAFLVADAAFCISLGQSVSSVAAAAALLIAAVILWIFAVLIGCYSFVMMSIISLKAGQILKNAILLIFLEPLPNLLLLLIVGGGTAAAYLLLPVSIPAVGVIWMSLLALAACTIINTPLEKRIIGPSDGA